MYRCGWGEKADQETVLAVEIEREGFDWALRNACLSHDDRDEHADRGAWKRELKGAPARVQWDPERDLWLRALPYRSLQLGPRVRRRGGTRMSGRWRSPMSPRWPGRSMRGCAPGRPPRPPPRSPKTTPTRHPRELRAWAACPGVVAQTRKSGRCAVRRGLLRVAYGT